MKQRTCAFPGCDRPRYGKGLCNTHWVQQRKGKPLTPIRTHKVGCTYPGCTNKHHGGGLCGGHWMQQAEGRPLTELKHSGLGKSEEERFWHYVRKGSGCWEWVGAITKGYGRFGNQSAHRYSYELHVGSIPKGFVVRHMCFNPVCVNPDHLAIGTVKDNIHDTIRAGRWTRGESQWNSKLTEADVRAIYADERNNVAIAADYGVHKNTVRDIKKKRSWKHLWT